MIRKSFFRERSVEEIQELSEQRVFNVRGLVRKILDLNPASDALTLQTPILPLSALQRGIPWRVSARKYYKHGPLISLSQPQSLQIAYACREIPLKIRERDFNRLRERREEDVFFVGYSWYPVQGRDRLKRVVSFTWNLEAIRLFGYAENRTEGIKVKPYPDARKVSLEGANIVCEVPSRTKKMPRYKLLLKHVPVDGTTERRAVAWSLCSRYGSEEKEGTPPTYAMYDIRYRYEQDREGSEVFRFYPHDIAAYIAVIKEYNQQKNLTPLEMSPLALASQREAAYYTRLCNNVLIYDPTSHNFKGGMRKLYVAEKAVLIARSIAVLGHDETMYWEPTRDGLLKNYPWNVPAIDDFEKPLKSSIEQT